MIGYIKGSVEGISQDYVLVENQGIGYRIYTSAKVIEQLSQMHEVQQFYTYLHVREDDLSLFGFLSMQELDTFKLLISVSGIGPKAALAILSVLTVKDLSIAVMTGDTKAITKANGVGTKGANRVIMELKDKLALDDIINLDEEEESILVDHLFTNSINDTIMALVSLGYSNAEANKAISQIPNASELESEELLKLALKKMF